MYLKVLRILLVGCSVMSIQFYHKNGNTKRDSEAYRPGGNSAKYSDKNDRLKRRIAEAFR
jgi:hypothetical protein